MSLSKKYKNGSNFNWRKRMLGCTKGSGVGTTFNWQLRMLKQQAAKCINDDFQTVPPTIFFTMVFTSITDVETFFGTPLVTLTDWQNLTQLGGLTSIYSIDATTVVFTIDPLAYNFIPANDFFFSQNQYLIQIIDDWGIIYGADFFSFVSSPFLSVVYLPALDYVGFGAFSGCPIVNLYAPNVTYVEANGFQGIRVTTLNFPI